jgi:PDZ domain
MVHRRLLDSWELVLIAVFQTMKSGLIQLLVAGFVLSGLPNRVCAVEPPAAVLKSLASDDFKTREKAQAGLLEWAKVNQEPAAVALMKFSMVSEEPEVRQRCLAVLRDLAYDDYLKTGEGYVGILMRDEIARVPGDEGQRSAIRVSDVVEGSAGHEAGLRANDLIVGMDDEVWRGVPASFAFSAKIRQLKPGARVTLKLLREEKTEDVVIRLGKRPVGADQRFFGQVEAAEAIEKAARDEHFRQWMADLSRKHSAKQ